MQSEALKSAGLAAKKRSDGCGSPCLVGAQRERAGIEWPRLAAAEDQPPSAPLPEQVGR
jgi:hypothetical protein